MKHKSNKKEQSKIKRRQWQAHLYAWGRSGLTQNEYCKQHNLSSSKFCYWKKKLTQQSKPSVSFIPVPICTSEKSAHPVNNDSGLTIFLKSGIRIRLNNSFNSQALANAVSALGDKP
jgi:hypothetical protein